MMKIHITGINNILKYIQIEFYIISHYGNTLELGTLIHY